MTLNEPQAQQESVEFVRKQALNKRLETIAWGLFLIGFGLVALLPDRLIPDGFGFFGAGLVLIGLNAARYFLQIKMSGFTLVLGTIAIVVGLSRMFGAELPIFAVLLILIGLYIILRPVFERRQRSSEEHTVNQ